MNFPEDTPGILQMDEAETDPPPLSSSVSSPPVLVSTNLQSPLTLPMGAGGPVWRNGYMDGSGFQPFSMPSWNVTGFEAHGSEAGCSDPGTP